MVAVAPGFRICKAMIRAFTGGYGPLETSQHKVSKTKKKVKKVKNFKKTKKKKARKARRRSRR